MCSKIWLLYSTKLGSRSGYMVQVGLLNNVGANSDCSKADTDPAIACMAQRWQISHYSLLVNSVLSIKRSNICVFQRGGTWFGKILGKIPMRMNFSFCLHAFSCKKAKMHDWQGKFDHFLRVLSMNRAGRVRLTWMLVGNRSATQPRTPRGRICQIIRFAVNT